MHMNGFCHSYDLIMGMKNKAKIHFYLKIKNLKNSICLNNFYQG